MNWKKTPHAETLKDYPNLKEFLPFLDTHNSESPRGSVLVACSFLDEQLKEVISAFLIEDSDKAVLLEGFNAPIGTFSARIKMAHSLGLISDSERDDCDTLRKIRNALAHDHRASFEDQKLIDLCANLHHSAKSYDDVVVGTYGQFSSGAVGLILNLVNRSHYVGKERLIKKTWQY